ncbi:hypothetical protein A9Q84_01005 [Halobacteriovorax marinus]|uniref:Mechanosensitive ion channel MscS domain-containing protein n=1 Tax=Halobacteriovorax marinus TaxID=97084 RepID=A0A1Y5FC87_9BACT|nr:hypothetical protein A9Q84_01005 [Halobacteriovorax marinus]
MVIVILASPLSDDTKGDLLSFFGIIISAAIALSSTTFLGNIMAGFMIRTLRKIQPGDFLRIDDYFGRVTELGLLHTEIQTPDRDLTIMPNLMLVNKPLKIMHKGTIISCEVSLGYDVPRESIEKALLKAATQMKLEAPYVHIQGLGDFSVLYKLSGYLDDIKTLISSKAQLHANVLDSLHHDGIEIVSPAFMNQRVFKEDAKFISKKTKGSKRVHSDAPEKVMFEKAQEVAEIENIKNKIIEIRDRITALKLEVGNDQEIQVLENEKAALKEVIKRESEESKG